MAMQQYQNQFANFAQQQRGMMGDIAQGTTNVLASGAYTAQGVGGLFDQYRKFKALNQQPINTQPMRQPSFQGGSSFVEFPER